jgi:hypothetical protein
MKITVEILNKSYDFDTDSSQTYRINSKIRGTADELIHEITNSGNTIKIKLLYSGLNTYSSAYPSGQVCPKCKGTGKI